MNLRRKIAVGILTITVIGLGIFVIVFFQAAKGLDASKEDPQKLFMFYVQKEIPRTMKMIGAVGHAYPMGGTGITLKFEIGQEDAENLISAKHLQKDDNLQEGLFSPEDLGDMKHPEFFWSDTDTTWSPSRSAVRMIWDKDRSRILYMVFSS